MAPDDTAHILLLKGKYSTSEVHYGWYSNIDNVRLFS